MKITLRSFFAAIYVIYVTLSVLSYGFPRSPSQFIAIFIVPAASVLFLYFFYSSIIRSRKNKK